MAPTARSAPKILVHPRPLPLPSPPLRGNLASAVIGPRPRERSSACPFPTPLLPTAAVIDGEIAQLYYDVFDVDCYACGAQVSDSLPLLFWALVIVAVLLFFINKVVRFMRDSERDSVRRVVRRWQSIKGAGQALYRGTGGNQLRELISFSQVCVHPPQHDVTQWRAPRPGVLACTLTPPPS